MEILSQGEKIKRIRKNFKIRQQDITGGEITRELISIIENNKTNLTPSVAQIIADNINKICKERNIDFTVKASYLLEDISEQANKVADNYIEFLNNHAERFSKNLINEIKEIEGFCMKYGEPEKKVTIYERIGDICENGREYDKSYIYYIKALENATKLKNTTILTKIIQKIGALCLRLMKYEDAIYFNSLVLMYDEAISKELKYKVLFNNVLANIYLKEYKKALDEIHALQNMVLKLEKEDIFELNILKVHCFRYLNLFTDALKLNKETLSELSENDFEKKILVLANILDIYTALKDYKNIRSYLKKVINEISRFSDIEHSYHGPNVHLQIGISLTLLRDIDLAKVYYDKALNFCKKQKNFDILEKTLEEYLNILLEENNSENINDFKNTILELLSLKIISQDNINIIRLIKFYNSIGDSESIDSLLAFVLENK